MLVEAGRTNKKAARNEMELEATLLVCRVIGRGIFSALEGVIESGIPLAAAAVEPTWVRRIPFRLDSLRAQSLFLR